MAVAIRASTEAHGRKTKAPSPRAGSALPQGWPVPVQRLAPAQQRAIMTSLGATAGNRAVASLVARGGLPPVGPPRLQRFVGGLLETLGETFNVELGASVGARGANRPSDVRRVQLRLARLGFLGASDAARERPGGPAPAPQDALSATIAAITRYQTDVVGLRRGDGRVDPGGRTQQALAAHQSAPLPRPAADTAAVGGAAGAAVGELAGATAAGGSGGDHDGQAGGDAPVLGTAAGVTVAEFLSRHSEELQAFRLPDDELTFVLDLIIRKRITDVNAQPWMGKKVHERALAPALFARRHGVERLAAPLPDDAVELARIRFRHLFPLLAFVLPRITDAPRAVEGAPVGERISAAAHNYLGTRYVLGGCMRIRNAKDRAACGAKEAAKSEGIDCSGLVSRVLADLGLPWKSSGKGAGVDRLVDGGTFIHHDDAPETGDMLLRWDSKNGRWGHIGIYIGGGKLIDAPYTGTVVRQSSYDVAKWHTKKLRYPAATPK